jgi:membrane fusion protein, multidrug efflux system
MSRIRFKLAGLVAVCAAVAAASYHFYSSPDEQQTARTGRGPIVALVTLATVERHDIADQIEAVGTLIANESLTITAQVTDRVNKIHFDDGEYVVAGDILVELTSVEESAQLAEAQVNLDESERKLNRLVTLGSNVASASLIDEARSLYNANQAKFDTIIARMDDRVITAPFSGVLGFRQISPGSLVSAGTVITTLDDVSVVKLDFSVPETYLNSVISGNQVLASSAAWPDRTFRGKVEAIGSRVDPVGRSVMVRANLSNEDYALRPGMLMTVKLTGPSRSAILVPEASVVQTGEVSYVYVVDDENAVSRREVVIQERRSGAVVISSGLTSGERVVVDGVSTLVPGGKVKVVDSRSGEGLS